jgi:hypothetical protein
MEDGEGTAHPRIPVYSKYLRFAISNYEFRISRTSDYFG